MSSFHFLGQNDSWSVKEKHIVCPSGDGGGGVSLAPGGWEAVAVIRVTTMRARIQTQVVRMAWR